MSSKDSKCVDFLQSALPKLRMRWDGFRKVRRQVCRRIEQRIKQLGLDDIAAYRDYLESEASEWSRLDQMCRISISRFYRDRGVFNLLRDEVFPRLAETVTVRTDKTIRIWSAGCASGEEPYTLKLMWEIGLQSRFPELDLEITATDADPHLLERAHRGCYPASSIKDFPSDWLDVAFTRSDGEYRVVDRFRNGINFQLQDIRCEQPAGPFDLILCRHLAFTYFDESLQRKTLAQINKRLAPGGFLVIGKQESLPRTDHFELQEVKPHSGIYVRASNGQRELVIDW